MARFTVRDNSGSVVGHISDSDAPGAGCIGCIGLSVLAAIIWAGISLYQVIQMRIANNKIEAQRVVLSDDILNSYTGEYNYARYKIRIERRGSKLFNKSPEEFCELVPVSSNEFIYSHCANGFQGRAKFVRDAQRNLALIVLHKDGREERAAKVD